MFNTDSQQQAQVKATYYGRNGKLDSPEARQLFNRADNRTQFTGSPVLSLNGRELCCHWVTACGSDFRGGYFRGRKLSYLWSSCLKVHSKFRCAHHDGMQDIVPIPNPAESKTFQRAIVFLKGKGWARLHWKQCHLDAAITRGVNIGNELHLSV